MSYPQSCSTAAATIGATTIRNDFSYVPAMTLPVIDVSPLRGDCVRSRRKIADAIGAAARDIGFFCIRNHGIDAALIERVYAQAARFFALPEAHKLAYYIGHSRNHRGYVPRSEKGVYADESAQRRYEAFDLALELPATDPDVIAGHPLLGPNVWPDDLAGFRETVSQYYEDLRTLGETLCRAFELHLGLADRYFHQYMRKPTSQLRLLHYLGDQLAPSEQSSSMGAHTDYECFTILHQQRPGLQILDRSNTWNSVSPPTDTLIINIGDMLEVWSNGAFRSTVHRVVNEDTERYSLPFFVAADFDAVIEPVMSDRDSALPRRYESYQAGLHLLGQLVRDFPYLRERYDSGQLELPYGVPGNNPFEQRLTAACGTH